MMEWARLYPGWVYLLLAVVLVGLMEIARRSAISQRLRRSVLFLPRAIVLGSLLLILQDPVRRSEFQLPARPAQVIALVDCSRSMALDAPWSRLDQVRQAIEACESAARGDDEARLALFRFGAQLSSSPDLRRLAALDESSELGAALENLPSRFSREPPRAVVIFSDGIATDPGRLSDVGAGYRRLGIPLHVYPVGNDRIKGDLAIQDLVIPRRVDAHTRVTVRGVLRNDGFDGERVELKVRPAKAAAAGFPSANPGVGVPQSIASQPPLITLPLTLEPGEQPFEFVIDANPDQADLVLEVQELEGEVSFKNNRLPFQIIGKPNRIRVIYMEGTGTPEYRWVHDALIEDPEIECLSIVVDSQYAQRPRLMRVDDSYRGYPATREELLGYDVVICSDISRGAFTKEQLDWTVELVAQRGGGFAMVGGITSFGAGGWDQTVWDKLIPVDMTGGMLGRGWLYHDFRVQIPKEVENHPIWRIVTDPAQNRRVLDAMPPFGGTNYMTRLKPAATLLAVSATPIPQAGIMPIFACESYGKGRTFAFAPDTTVDWGRFFESQWGEGGDNRYFRRFWRNVVRWLSENSIHGNRRLIVETDRLIYRTGQPVELTAIAYDEQLEQTTGYELTAHWKTTSKAALPGHEMSKTAADRSGIGLLPSPDGHGYVGQFPTSSLMFDDAAQPENLQGMATREIEVVASHQGKEVVRKSAIVHLLADSPELRKPRAEPDRLRELAQATDGNVLHSAGELRQLLQSLPATRGDIVVTRTPLWDRGLFWLMILVCLSLEWLMRRIG
jgi:uncharacterized membrane protein